MRTWKDIEARRERAGISRAEMCRRAGINESTVFKGVARDGRPLNSIRRLLDAVLTAAEGEAA